MKKRQTVQGVLKAISVLCCMVLLCVMIPVGSLEMEARAATARNLLAGTSAWVSEGDCVVSTSSSQVTITSRSAAGGSVGMKGGDAFYLDNYPYLDVVIDASVPFVFAIYDLVNGTWLTSNGVYSDDFGSNGSQSPAGKYFLRLSLLYAYNAIWGYCPSEAQMTDIYIEPKGQGTIKISRMTLNVEGSTGANQEGDYAYAAYPNMATLTAYTGSASNVTVPAYLGSYKVVSVGWGTFKEKTWIRSVQLPDTLRDIGANAFYGCTGLQDIAIPNGTKFIYADAFKGCSALERVFLPDTIAYIDPDAFVNCPNVWIVAAEGTYGADYAKKYGMLFSQSGNQLAHLGDAETYKSLPKAYEYGTSKAISGADIRLNGDHLTAKKAGYYSVDVATLQVRDMASFAMVPESHGGHISSVYCDGKDAIMNTIDVNGDETIDIFVNSDGTKYEKAQLMQGASVVANSTDGHFTIKGSALTEEVPLKVRLVIGGTKQKAITTNIVPQPPKGDWSFSTDIHVKMDEDIPFLGGGEFAFDLTPVGVQMVRSGDAFRIGIGVSDLEEFHEKYGQSVDEKWAEFKKQVKKSKATLNELYNPKKSKGKIDGGFGMPDSDLDVVGYLEGTFGDEKTASGMVQLSYKVKVEGEWQTVAFSVPIVLKTSFAVGLETEWKIGVNFTAKELILKSDVELTLPEITASAGVGLVGIGDVSVYGKAANKLKFTDDFARLRMWLEGELGVSAKFFLWSSEVPILDGKWPYYDSGAVSSSSSSSSAAVYAAARAMNGDLSEEEFVIKRPNADGESAWMGERMSTFALRRSAVTEDHTVRVLQNDIYNDAGAVLLSLGDGYRMLLWIGDEATRTTGNHTAAMYSLYDPLTDSWTAPQLIDDDGTADFHIQAVEQDGVVYVMFTDSSIVFEAEPTMQEMASSCEVSIAVFDSATGTFAVTQLTEDDILDAKPTMMLHEGSIVGAYYSLKTDDPLAQGGETVLTMVTEVGETMTYLPIATVTDTVTDLAVGTQNGNAVVCYVTQQATQTGFVHTVNLYDVASAQTTVVTSGVTVSDVQFASIGGQDWLLWNEGGVIKGTKDDGVTVETILENASILDSGFAVVEGEHTTALLATSADTMLYGYVYENDAWSEPVLITQSEGYIRDIHGYFDENGNIIATFSRTAVDITTVNVEEVSDLCTINIEPVHETVLKAIDYDPSDAVAGAALPITATVENIGFFEEEGLRYNLYTGTDLVYSERLDVTLSRGETKTLEITAPLPQTFTGVEVYTLEIVCENAVEANTQDNLQTYLIGETDIGMTVSEVSSKEGSAVIVQIANYSEVPTTANLVVHAEDESGEVLRVYPIDELQAGAREVYRIESEDVITARQNGVSRLYMELVSDASETQLADNTAALSIAYSEECIGDVNKDGRGNTSDARLMMLEALQGGLLTEEQMVIADVDYNAILDTTDVKVLMEWLIVQ